MRIISYIFIFCFPLLVFSQNRKLDSLLLEEKKPTHDTIKAMVFFQLANIYSKNGEIERSNSYFAKAKVLTFINYKTFYSKILRYDATSLKRQTKYQMAIDTLRKALKFCQENDLEKELGNSYVDIGVIYRITGNFKFSIENILKSVIIREKYPNKTDIMNSYNSLANSYSALAERTQSAADFEKSIEYYKKAESYIENNPRLTVMILSNLGVTNGYIGKIKKDSNIINTARNYHLRSYEIHKQLKDTLGLIDVLSNLGVINFDLGDAFNDLKYLYSAEQYFLKAIALGKYVNLNNQYGNIGNLAGTYLSIAKITHSKETSLKGIKLCEEALAAAENAQDRIIEVNMLGDLMNAYEDYGDSKKAFLYAKQFINAKDSMLNTENNNAIQELSTKFETDKKEQENKILKQQAELNVTQLKQQKIVSYSLIFGVIVLIVLSVLIYKNLNLSKKSNRIISLQKLEVEKQKHLVEEKQKEVLDSINYAKRLQDAILPQVNSIKESFEKLNGDAFIVYQPKDIVAGDFYFFEEANDHLFIAAADCTGHGVPGAMVSVVCSNALTRSVKEFNLTDPGKILDKTTELVLDTFSKSVGQVKDGMDISLLCIHKKNRTISWSGANNPLWYIKAATGSNEIAELKPNKQPIGQSDDKQPFVTQSVSASTGCMFYLITDGYADQFGGEAGKKLMSKNFKKLLSSVFALPLDEQATTISKNFNAWKGGHEQVDDVCVIGIKI